MEVNHILGLCYISTSCWLLFQNEVKMDDMTRYKLYEDKYVWDHNNLKCGGGNDQQLMQ